MLAPRCSPRSSESSPLGRGPANERSSSSNADMGISCSSCSPRLTSTALAFPTERAGPFTANLGGFLSALLYGLTGITIGPGDPATWCQRPPSLPASWRGDRDRPDLGPRRSRSADCAARRRARSDRAPLPLQRLAPPSALRRRTSPFTLSAYRLPLPEAVFGSGVARRKSRFECSSDRGRPEVEFSAVPQTTQRP